MGNSSILSNRVNLQGTLLDRDAVDVHGPIATLRSDILIQRVPCNALNKMIMFGNFIYTFP